MVKEDILLYGHCEGSQARGRPNRKWLDNIKEDCSDPGITLYKKLHNLLITEVTENTLFTMCAASRHDSALVVEQLDQANQVICFISEKLQVMTNTA